MSNATNNSTGSDGSSNHNRQDSLDFSDGPTTNNPVDPFGRSRDWASMPPRASSSGSRKPAGGDASFSSSGQPLTTSGSNNSSAINTASNEPPSTESEPPPPPLLVSSLGDNKVVQRAETVVSHLLEIVGSSDSKTKELPSKIEITKAMAEVDKLLQTTKSESRTAEEDIKKAKDEEEITKIEEANKAEEEKNQRKLEIEQRKEDRRKEEEHSKVLAEQEAEDESKIRCEVALKKRKIALDEQVAKAKEGKKTLYDEELEAKIKEASSAMDKSIARARRDMEKSKTIAKEITKKLTKAEKQHKVNAENEKKKKLKKKKPAKKESIPLEDIVNSITVENKRKAKEAQGLALSIADPNFGLRTFDSHASLQQPDAPHEVRDPKYKKTFEEWAIMANQVTGLSNSLYSEPSETPYFDLIQEHHGLIGPLVKEYVRDKQTRLNKHWLMLAEEYEVRKRLYEKQQRKLAKKAQRVSVTSRKSILGNKEKEKPEDKGSKPIESGGRSSNNPYRRARRGNEVRSEYEQEQIIAEIAAREAMEKRITHGGSKLPRQVCLLERVSFVAVAFKFFLLQALKETKEQESNRSSFRFSRN